MGLVKNGDKKCDFILVWRLNYKDVIKNVVDVNDVSFFFWDKYFLFFSLVFNF